MPKNLLVADDSLTIRKVIGMIFATEDFQVTAVDNGLDAITRSRELRPDVVLADVMMPGKNGYEVCEALKNDPATQNIPVLLLAGTFEAFDEARARAARADDHITKPFESQVLLDKVKTLVGQKSNTMPASAATQVIAAAPAAAAPTQPRPPAAGPTGPGGMPRPPGPGIPPGPGAPGMARPGVPPGPGMPPGAGPRPGMPPGPGGVPPPGMARPGMPPGPGCSSAGHGASGHATGAGGVPPPGMTRPGMPPGPGGVPPPGMARPGMPPGPGGVPPPGMARPGMPPGPGVFLRRARGVFRRVWRVQACRRRRAVLPWEGGCLVRRVPRLFPGRCLPLAARIRSDSVRHLLPISPLLSRSRSPRWEGWRICHWMSPRLRLLPWRRGKLLPPMGARRSCARLSRGLLERSSRRSPGRSFPSWPRRSFARSWSG
ncbi:PleD family two-component system response regulator [Archangium minus]|uniref:PleD family two-component system response regulator n=1 Tax=Archangium minus TaxID=83450 RepID=UPI0037C07526